MIKSRALKYFHISIFRLLNSICIWIELRSNIHTEWVNWVGCGKIHFVYPWRQDVPRNRKFGGNIEKRKDYEFKRVFNRRNNCTNEKLIENIKSSHILRFFSESFSRSNDNEEKTERKQKKKSETCKEITIGIQVNIENLYLFQLTQHSNAKKREIYYIIIVIVSISVSIEFNCLK